MKVEIQHKKLTATIKNDDLLIRGNLDSKDFEFIRKIKELVEQYYQSEEQNVDEDKGPIKDRVIAVLKEKHPMSILNIIRTLDEMRYREYYRSAIYAMMRKDTATFIKVKHGLYDLIENQKLGDQNARSPKA